MKYNGNEEWQIDLVDYSCTLHTLIMNKNRKKRKLIQKHLKNAWVSTCP